MSPTRVLVVDDNVDSAKSIAALLRGWGHEVHLAHDGRAAIAAARLLHPDYLLLDIGLPGMDGFEVAARLRDEPGLDAMRVIAMSALPQGSDSESLREACIDEYLTKPLDTRFLESLLRRR